MIEHLFQEPTNRALLLQVLRNQRIIISTLQALGTQMADESAAITKLTAAVDGLATSTANEVTELQKISAELTALAAAQGTDNSPALSALADRIAASAAALDTAASAAAAADPTAPTPGA